MSFSPEDLLTALDDLERTAGPASRFVVAFSGGLDSTALLAALADSAGDHGTPLVAVHVNHQLHSDAGAWARHCRRVAEQLGVAFEVETVTVTIASGAGPEASARNARYAALQKHVTPGDWLLSAHHRDDQAETLLYNLLRGSGPAGIAGIHPIRRFGQGWLARPLLHTDRRALRDWADQRGLSWIDDPSNEASLHDRNFLRNDVLPLLESRWPGVAARLARSAAHAREAVLLADELADDDIVLAGGHPARLFVSVLNALSLPRRNNVLRRAAVRLGLPPMPASALAGIVGELLTAREDAAPLVRWSDAEARRYRDVLFLMRPLAKPRFGGRALGTSPVALGAGLGAIRLAEADGPGLSAACASSGLTLATRQGGEEIRVSGQRHTKKLKKLLQEEGIVPWMRERLPLVYSGSTLVAVADLWLADGCVENGGYALLWTDRPALR